MVIQIGGAVNGHEGYSLITPHMEKHFTVIDFDHRGYGQSDRPDQKYTMDTWVDDMAALLDALGIEKCHVHGGSMGGFIAGPKYVIEYLKHKARCFIFTASLAPSVAGGVLKALEVMQHRACPIGVVVVLGFERLDLGGDRP